MPKTPPKGTHGSKGPNPERRRSGSEDRSAVRGDARNPTRPKSAASRRRLAPVEKVHCDGQELTRKAVGGNPEVLGELARCLEARLLEFGKRYCGNDEDARDALQDAYESAFRHLKGFRGEASIKTWLTRLLISACSRRRRGARNDPSRHRPLELTPAQEARYLAVDVLPADEAERSEMYEMLQSALMDLGETDRLVLLLRDGQQMTAPEAASLLGLSVSAVKSRLHRARKQVREALARME